MGVKLLPPKAAQHLFLAAFGRDGEVAEPHWMTILGACESSGTRNTYSVFRSHSKCSVLMSKVREVRTMCQKAYTCICLKERPSGFNKILKHKEGQKLTQGM